VLPSPCWSLHLTGFLCVPEAFTSTHWEDEPLLEIKLSIGAWWNLLLATREVTNHHLHNPGQVPKKCRGNLKLRYGTLRQFSRKEHFLVPAQTQRIHFKGWAQRTKRSHLIYPCKHVTEAKSKAQPTYGYMWLHWLFYSPSVMWPSSCFSSLSFISLLCHPFPLPRYQNTACLFLFWSFSLLQYRV
jgi:hypothetical protein